MTRTERLLQLMQILRQHRYPVSGATLAAALGISLRSLYRDIAILQAQGANIEGEAGVGYLLRPGFLLPPLMFSEEEVEALALGYFEQVRMLAAWCEWRQAFRHFRADRMVRAAVSGERYPGGRMRLVKVWREAEGIGETGSP